MKPHLKLIAILVFLLFHCMVLLTSNLTVSAETIGNGTASNVSWDVSSQATGVWKNSTWSSRSFRILLSGANITRSGNLVQLTLKGRTSGNYTVTRVSLVRREGPTLNGVDSTNAQVTFGNTWAAGVTVPANGSVTSDPIPFDLITGQDVFLTFWAVTPTTLKQGTAEVATWTIPNTDHSGTIDWGGLTISETRSFIYIAENLVALGSSGGGSGGGGSGGGGGTSPQSLILSWNPNTESDLAGYKVYLKYSTYESFGSPLAILLKDTTIFTFTGLQSNTTYYFGVSAFDDLGNESGMAEISESIY